MLVIGRIGAQRFAWPASAVERVLPMAAITHVADVGPEVAGFLDVHGDTLAVVDPRVRLGLPAALPSPDQYLILITTPRRFLLWVDRVDDVVATDSPQVESIDGQGVFSSALYMTHVDGELVPVLSPAAFDPGSLTAPGAGSL